jgi:hypothetical protein
MAGSSEHCEVLLMMWLTYKRKRSGIPIILVNQQQKRMRDP